MDAVLDAVLEGSVRRDGNRLRVAVWLVNVSNGYCMWSDRYDRQLEDVFQIHDDLAERVVRGLSGAFGPEDRAALGVAAHQIEINPSDARALYFGAIALIELGERKRGLQWGRRAIEVDPHDLNLLYNIACLYALAGDSDAAIDALQKVVVNGCGNLAWLQQDSDLDPLRDDPRFVEMLNGLK